MQTITRSLLFMALIGAVSACFDPHVDQSAATSGPNANARRDNPPRTCATMDVLAENLKEDPSLAQKLGDVEKHASRFAQLRDDDPAGDPYRGVVTIPVQVHVIYSTAQQNISNAQIQSQITVLNRDYRKTNSDASQLPEAFEGLASDMRIQFVLAGIDRKSSDRVEWGTRDAMKKSKKGGVDPIDPANNLNIWICNIGGGILGYAQFPGGAAATDGVVIGPEFFGSSSLTSGYFAAPYDKGRTATHEVGHWLNLRHIWGDERCGDDLVSDTPTQKTSNFGCPEFPHKTCGNGPSGDLFMNYMDYTDDACMYMFSNGQNKRSRALFASDGARRSFVE